mmetsp:Transcript_23197/g.39814  ORF Transcript_23197/g.39814 Transcript_23197/m.39814 type:complete len:291 (-) Transcript_23197:396-1268(-)
MKSRIRDCISWCWLFSSASCCPTRSFSCCICRTCSSKLEILPSDSSWVLCAEAFASVCSICKRCNAVLACSTSNSNASIRSCICGDSSSCSCSSSPPPSPSYFFNRCLSSSISSINSAILASLGSNWILGLFLICLARSANRRVDTVSEISTSLGRMLANIAVFEPPPRLSFRSIVKGLERNGMCPLAFTMLSMTVPRAESDKLILAPSFSRSPTALVLDWRSLPAKSTKFSLEVTTLQSPSSLCSVFSNQTVNNECDREECAFRSVSPTSRRSVPSSMRKNNSVSNLHS